MQEIEPRARERIETAFGAKAFDHDRLRASLARSFALASSDDLEAWRIAAGRPRMGVDALEGDLPQEAGLMDAVDPGKARYLGREAVAGIQDSTPLRIVVLVLETSEPVSPDSDPDRFLRPRNAPRDGRTSLVSVLVISATIIVLHGC